jgi:hypothetical protein
MDQTNGSMRRIGTSDYQSDVGNTGSSSRSGRSRHTQRERDKRVTKTVIIVMHVLLVHGAVSTLCLSHRQSLSSETDRDSEKRERERERASL